MTVRDGELTDRIMRHSSSWPVKVRINPTTRSYTIIPTFHGDKYCCEFSARLNGALIVKSEDEKTAVEDPTRICILEIEKKSIYDVDEPLTKLYDVTQEPETVLEEKNHPAEQLSEDDVAYEGKESVGGVCSQGMEEGNQRFMQDLLMMDGKNPPTSFAECQEEDSKLSGVIQSFVQHNQSSNRKWSQLLRRNDTWPVTPNNGSSCGDFGTVFKSESLKCNRKSNLAACDRLQEIIILNHVSSEKLRSKSSLEESRSDYFIRNERIPNGNESRELRDNICRIRSDSPSDKSNPLCQEGAGEADDEEGRENCSEEERDSETGNLTRRTNHACPKCTAQGLLELKIDPFRVQPAVEAPQPSRTSQRNCPESGTFTERRYRSQSTKHESRADIAKTNLAQRSKSFGGNLKNNAENGTSGKHLMDQRKEATLRRHYYPEGGWGYVIVTCSALVHFLGIGLQLSAPGSWHVSAELKFHHPPLHSAG